MWANTVWQVERYYWLFWNRILSQFQHICLGLNCLICEVFLHVCFSLSLTMNLRPSSVSWALHPACVVLTFLHSKSRGLVNMWSPGISMRHRKPASEETLFLAEIRLTACIELFIHVVSVHLEMLCNRIWYMQTVNICISKDIRYTEPTHVYLPNAFPTWRYRGCPSLLLCSFSIWKRQMLSLPLLTF